MLIILLGPDGCGKTSVANEIEKKLRKKLNIEHYSFSFKIIPSFTAIKGFFGVGKQSDTFINNQNTELLGMTKPEPTLKAILLSIWYGIDYVLGSLFFQNKNIVMSRSYHDFLFQRAYRNVPHFIPKTFLSIGATPDLIVLLKRDANSIYLDKPELTINEINHQFSLIEKSLKNFKNYRTLVAPNSVSKTADEVIKLLLN